MTYFSYFMLQYVYTKYKITRKIYMVQSFYLNIFVRAWNSKINPFPLKKNNMILLKKMCGKNCGNCVEKVRTSLEIGYYYVLPFPIPLFPITKEMRSVI